MYTDPSLSGGIDPSILEGIQNDPTIIQSGSGPSYVTIAGIVIVCCCCVIFMMMMMKGKKGSATTSSANTSVSSLPTSTV